MRPEYACSTNRGGKGTATAAATTVKMTAIWRVFRRTFHTESRERRYRQLAYNQWLRITRLVSILNWVPGPKTCWLIALDDASIIRLVIKDI